MAQTTWTDWCAFQGFQWYCSPLLNPQNPNFGGVNRHFQAKQAKSWSFHIIKTIASIATKFCTTTNTTKYISRVVQLCAQQIQDNGENRSTDFDEIWQNDALRPLWRTKKGKGSLYSITERRVLELVPVPGSQPARDVSHKPGSRLPLLSTRPTVNFATLQRAATNFAAWWTEARWVWTVCLRLLPDSVAAAIWTPALLHLSPTC